MGRSPIPAGLRAATVALALGACAPIAYETGPAIRPEAPTPPIVRVRPPPPGMAFDPPEIVRGGPALQCVPFARRLSGIQIFGDAHTWWAQADGRYPRGGIPAPGAVLVLEGYRTSARGHVAVVTGIISPREIRVDQANWLNGGEVTVRVPVLDVSPENDWTQVRMWHIPTNAWGARIYLAEGFIHPLPLIASIN